MSRDDIIRMAREAGFPFNKYGLLQGDDDGGIDADEMFERFASLVAAKERGACAITAVIHSQYPITTEYDRGFDAGSKRAYEAIRARGNS